MASIVYVLKNEAMPGLLKIGMTEQDSPDERMKQLHTTGVPLPFECIKAVEVSDNQQAKQIEDALHQAFDPHRVNPKREFFRIAEECVLAILNAWPSGKDVTSHTQEEIEAETDEPERQALKQAKTRRPNLDFKDLGIPTGARLVFIGPSESNETLEAVVKDNKKVLFQGEEMSHTKATLRALGKPDGFQIRPAPFWSYNGSSLYDLYEKLYGQN